MQITQSGFVDHRALNFPDATDQYRIVRGEHEETPAVGIMYVDTAMTVNGSNEVTDDMYLTVISEEAAKSIWDNNCAAETTDLLTGKPVNLVPDQGIDRFEDSYRVVVEGETIPQQAHGQAHGDLFAVFRPQHDVVV